MGTKAHNAVIWSETTGRTGASMYAAMLESGTDTIRTIVIGLVAISDRVNMGRMSDSPARYERGGSLSSHRSTGASSPHTQSLALL